MNLFSYASNNPTTLTDHTGLEPYAGQGIDAFGPWTLDKGLRSRDYGSFWVDMSKGWNGKVHGLGTYGHGEDAPLAIFPHPGIRAINSAMDYDPLSPGALAGPKLNVNTDCDKKVTLYHGSQSFKGDKFDLDLAIKHKRPGTPEPGIHLTDDIKRAATGYGRGGVVVRTEVPESFAQSIWRLSGPNGDQPEFFVNTHKQAQVLNNETLRALPSMDAYFQHLKGLF